MRQIENLHPPVAPEQPLNASASLPPLPTPQREARKNRRRMLHESNFKLCDDPEPVPASPYKLYSDPITHQRQQARAKEKEDYKEHLRQQIMEHKEKERLRKEIALREELAEDVRL